MTAASDELDQDFQEDPAVQLQADIAERFAILSVVADTPTEFDHAGGLLTYRTSTLRPIHG